MRRVLLLSLAPLLLLVLSSCSNDEGVAPSPPAAGPPETDPVATASAAVAATTSAPAPRAPPAAPNHALADASKCGDEPLSPCPLNAWMKANTSVAILAKDWDALGVALETTATFAPPGYPNWTSIAKDGADAARAQSLEGVKAACRSCHAQYRDRYRKGMRDRPI